MGAAAFIGIGIYLAVENPTDNYSAIFNDVDTAVWDTAVYLLIPLGVAIAGLAFTGCCGAWRESTCLIWVVCISHTPRGLVETKITLYPGLPNNRKIPLMFRNVKNRNT